MVSDYQSPEIARSNFRIFARSMREQGQETFRHTNPGSERMNPQIVSAQDRLRQAMREKRENLACRGTPNSQHLLKCLTQKSVDFFKVSMISIACGCRGILAPSESETRIGNSYFLAKKAIVSQTITQCPLLSNSE